MNETAPTTTEFILRRLTDPFPLDFQSYGVGALAAACALVLLGGLAAVGLLYLGDHRRQRWLAFPLVILRLVGIAFLVGAVAFPRANLTELWAPLENVAWIEALIGTLLIAISFVISFYQRDAQSCGAWSIPLATLRITVLLLLGFAFLLPAYQTWEPSEKRSRVILVLDISPSLSQTSDELSPTSVAKPKTRLDTVLDYLSDDQVGMLSKLLERNPVFVYRFGTRLDEEAHDFARGEATGWTRADWEAWTRYDFKRWVVRGLSPAGREALQQTSAWKGDEAGTADWASAWAKLPENETIPGTLSEPDRAVLKENRDRLEKRVDVARSLIQGTNVPDSVIAVVNREAGNMARGIIVFSDGRSNLGSASAIGALRSQVAGKIPIFTIAVGEARETVAITITDVQAPDRAPPDEQFKVVVEADGQGLAESEVDVTLGLFLPGRDPKQGQPDHELPGKLKFQGDTSPPHGTAEFVIDPEKVPAILTEESKKAKGKKQLKQGTWSAVARIPRDKREIFREPQHLSTPRPIQVIDRPIRVLLFGGATREYQTLRTLFVREMQQNRAEVSICLQSEGGQNGTAVQDVPPERILTRFPDRLDTSPKATDKPEDKYYNLNEYDVIIAFDPDWSERGADGNFRITDAQIKNVQSWVDNLGGGLIYVAGPLNTFQLSRAEETGRMKPLLDVMPVIPDDIILVKTRGVPRNPRRLLLKPNPEFDVLKLTDDQSEDPVAGWERFFTGREKYIPSMNMKENMAPTRGVYSYYPVKTTKPGASTLAEFLESNERGEPDPKPWLVSTQPARGRSVFVGSGEMWRLRAYDLDYYDRFWIKLSRYAAANRDVKASRGRVLIGKEFVAGSLVRIQARLLAPNGSPYDMNALSPKFTIVQYSPDGTTKLNEIGPFELRAKKGGGDFDGYYAGQVLADSARLPAGDFRYRVVVDVPDSPGDTLTGDFSVKKSDPELDNTRPDFAALEAMAGTLDEVKARIKDNAIFDKLRGAERDPTRVKLAFRLSEKDRLGLIPACIDEDAKSTRNRAGVRDLWDRGFRFELPGAVSLFGREILPKQGEIGYLLLGIVGLLAIEWMTRKLLRLA